MMIFNKSVLFKSIFVCFVFIGSFLTTATSVEAAPTIINVTSSSDNGYYKDGATIPILIQFSEAVKVLSGGIFINTNSGQIASYTSGSETDTLIFTYTPMYEANVADLEAFNIQPNGFPNPIVDFATELEPASLVVPLEGVEGSLSFNKDIAIDNTAPTVESAEIVGVDQVDITYSEPVISIADDYTGFGGILNGRNITAVATSGAVVSLTFDGDPINTGAEGYINIIGAGISDRAGNGLADYIGYTAQGYVAGPEEYVFAEGSGIEGDPYEVSECAALAAINNDLDAWYELTTDLDCREDGNDIMIADTEDLFEGHFDGNEHTIQVSFSGYDTSYIGLFRQTNNATILDLALEGTIEGSFGEGGGVGHVGFLSGAMSGGVLENITASGTIIAIGGSWDNTSYGLVAGTFYAGSSTNIVSHGSISVTDGSQVGGLFGGSGCYSHMSDSYSSATIEVLSDASEVGYIGGLSGQDGGMCEPPTVSRLHFTGTISSNSGYAVGGLFGSSASTIEDSYSSGTVESGGDTIGGLIGAFGGTLLNASTTGVTRGTLGGNVGGLIGLFELGSVASSSSFGDVFGQGDRVGGLVGESDEESTIVDSYSRSYVYGDGDYTGGLVGRNYGTIERSYSHNQISEDAVYGDAGVEGYCIAGGLVGRNYGSILNSYSRSEVYEDDGCGVGGLVGEVESGSTISQSYAAGAVSEYGSYGGFIGYFNDGAISSYSFWDVDTTGTNNACGNVACESEGIVMGTTSDAMRTEATFTTNLGEGGWDFVNVWQISSELNAGYPDLRVISVSEEAPVEDGADYESYEFEEGDGSEGDPYEITSCTALRAIENDMDAYYELMNDVTCNNIEPIGYNSEDSFYGSLDGNDYTITFSIDLEESSVGLFGYVSEGSISDLNLAGSVHGYSTVGSLAGVLEDGAVVTEVSSTVAVSGMYRRIGGLIGDFFDSTISSSTFSGTVSVVANNEDESIRYIGGLVGESDDGIIENSTASTTITIDPSDIDYTSIRELGGIAGDAEGTYINAVSFSGSIAATSSDDYIEYVGGLVGQFADGRITNSHATGTITLFAPNDYIEAVGGAVGESYYEDSRPRIIGNTVSIDITVESPWIGQIGGFIGMVDETRVVSNGAYGTVTVLAGYDDDGGPDSIGGFAGYADETTITDSFTQVDLDVLGYFNYGDFIGQEIGGFLGEGYDVSITNSYAANSINLEQRTTGYTYDRVGGFAGFLDDGATVTNSYSATEVTHSLSMDPALSGFAEFPLGNVTFTNNYFDADLVGVSDCSHTHGSIEACTPITEDADYFIDNTTSAPLDTWNFETIWRTQTADHPELRPYVAPVIEPYDFIGGDGSEGNPYQIDSCEALTAINRELDAHYILISDLECLDFEPLGYDTEDDDYVDFVGELDGDGYEIAITMDTGGQAGLFYELGENAYVHDLVISGEVSGQDDTGVLAGESYYATIENVEVHATVCAYGYSIGGLVGYAEYTDISGSSFTGTISPCTDAGIFQGGGLVGYGYHVSVSDSYSAGEIYGQEYTGGLIGYVDNDITDIEITQSYSTMDVYGTRDVGGLIGYAQELFMSDTYATGDVSGYSQLGGLIGRIEYSSIVIRSYAAGTIYAVGYDYSSTNEYIGGFIGQSYRSGIHDSFSASPVWFLIGYDESDEPVYETNPDSEDRIGGFVGNYYIGDDSDVTEMATNNYYDVERSYQNACVREAINDSGPIEFDCTGVNTEEVAQPNYFINSTENQPLDTWDFESIWMTQVEGYPVLQPFEEDTEAAVVLGEESLSVTEGGDVDVLHLQLATAPTADVVVTLSTQEEEVTLSEDTITFTTENWDEDQSVTVTAVNDRDVEGSHEDAVRFAVESEDENYSDLDVASIVVTITDNDIRRSGGGGGTAAAIAKNVVENTAVTVDNPALIANLQAQLAILMQQLAALTGETSVQTTVRDLESGMEGADVKMLQEVLIAQGYSIPAGATGVFANQTVAALSKYQQDNGITPASGYFGEKTRAQMKAKGLSGLWW